MAAAFMRVLCEHCSAEFDAPYWRSGSDFACPACSGTVRLDRAHIRSSAAAGTGYEVTFSDFVSLVTDEHYRPTILPLLRAWFGVELAEEVNEVRFRDADGDLYAALDVHARVQADPALQQTLYRHAMTLWHG